MERFEQTITDQDHAEALHIDALFDDRRNTTSDSAGALAYALETAEAELTKDHWETMPGVKAFGYGIAKNAWRWLSYIAAYSSEVEQAGKLHPDAEEVGAYNEEKGRLNDALLEEYPSSVHFGMLDLLERVRIQRMLGGEIAANPFILGREHTALLLTQTIEAVSQNPDQVVFRDTMDRLKFMDSTAHYIVEKPVPRGTRGKPVYVIDKQVDRQTAATYLVDGVVDPQDRASVMNSRSSQPGVDSCTILDMVFAMTWNNPHFADEAFERTQEILTQRRDEQFVP